MKSIVTLGIVILCSASLIACSNVTKQDVGTVTGGVAGGLLGSTVGRGGGQLVAIAAGALIGAYIGGSIGKSMDDTDKLKMNQALNNNPVGKPAYWHNSSSNTNYEVVPTKDVTVDGNPYCREYQTTAVISSKKQQVYGTACRQPDGSWKAAS